MWEETTGEVCSGVDVVMPDAKGDSLDNTKHTNCVLISPCNYIILLYFYRLWGKEQQRKKGTFNFPYIEFYGFCSEYGMEFIVS